MFIYIVKGSLWKLLSCLQKMHWKLIRKENRIAVFTILQILTTLARQSQNWMNEIHVLTHTSRFVGGEFIALVTGTEVAALGVCAQAVPAAVSIFSTFINIYVKELTCDKKLSVWVSKSRYCADCLKLIFLDHFSLTCNES